MKLRLTGTLVLVLGVAALASASAYAGNGNAETEKTNLWLLRRRRGCAGPRQLGRRSGTAEERRSCGTYGLGRRPDRPGRGSAGRKAVERHGARHARGSLVRRDEAVRQRQDRRADRGAERCGAEHDPPRAGQQPASQGRALLGRSRSGRARSQGKAGKGCGTQPPSPPHSTPDPGKVGDPAHGPSDSGGSTPVPSTSSPSVPSGPPWPNRS